MHGRPSPSVSPAFLAGGGETGGLMRGHDWSATPLGPPATWPQALSTLVGVMLGSQQPMLIVWGPERTTLYNDGYAAICGARHPAALGRPFEELWHDIWDQVEPILARAHLGEATHRDDIAFLMHRHGYPEETHFAFGYTPVRDETGGVAGMFCACVETTRQVMAEHRLRRSEAQAQGVLAGMTEGYILFDKDFGVVDVNAEGLRIDGRPREEVVGRTLWELWPATVGSAGGDFYRRVMEERVPATLEHRFKGGSGDVWLEMRAFPTAAGGVAAFYRDTSERKLAEERIRESEDNHLHAVELSPQTIWTARPDGQLDHVGPRWRDWTGTSGLGASWGEAVHPDDLAPSLAAWTGAVATGEPYDIEHRVRMLDGAYRWMHSRAYPRRDDRGAVARWYGTTEDIDDAQRADEARRQTEERLRLVVEGAKDHAIFTTDPSGRVTSWSAGAADIFGWRPEEAIGCDAAFVFTAEDRAAGIDRLELATAAHEGRANDERWHLRQDGRRVFMNGSVHRLPRDAAGREQGFLKIARDETDRRRQADALAESEARFRNMADHAPVMMWVTDPSGDCTYLNKRWYEFTGQSEQEALGLGWTKATHPDDETRAAEAFLAANAAQGPFQIEYRLRRADGAYRWAIDAASPRFGPGGAFLGHVGSVIDIDERRETEERLRESEAWARELATQQAAILSQLVEGVIVTDASGKITFVNDAAAAIHGVARLDVEPDAYSETYHLFTEDGLPYPPRALPLARAVRGENVTDARWRIRRPDGVEVLAIGSARPVRAPDGTAVGALLTLRDDTAREGAERALRESETRLRALTDNLPSGMVYQLATSPDGAERRFLYVSQSHGRLTGVPAEAVLADASLPYELILPEHRQALAAAEAAAIRDRTPFDVEARFRRADTGEIRWCRIISAPRELPDGWLVWDGIQIDTTEQKRAEIALRELNADLERQIVERSRERGRTWQVSPDLLGVANAAGYFESTNPAWAVALGWTEQEMRETRIFDLLHPEDIARTRIALEQLKADVPLLSFENRYRGRDGGYRWLSWVAVPEGGKYYCSARDITAEKQQAEALAQAEEALRQSQKMEAVGQLTGGIAHDFNNLLAGIVGSLDLMQTRMTQGRTENIERYAKAAMSSAQRAAALTHRLLAFSRRQPLDPKPVNANGLVASMEDLLRRTIGPLHALEFVTAGGLWMTLCDPNQLESAILNLAINARDAMPEGGKLTVETCNAHLDDAYAAASRDVTPGQYVCICITDTGTGMPADVISRAFEPFFTTKPLGQGTGLGLSMVYGFAKQSEGHLKIYSEVGQGTTIKIYLPRHRGAAEQEQPADPAVDAPRAEAGETVLVVEDEPVIRDLIVEVLQDLGYRALEASDGPSGLRLLQSRERIDLLVTDVGLPGLNGRQLADHARVKRPGLKVLFITGYAENATLANGFLDPGMEMITKPFAVDALGAKIRSMIGDG